ncbi:MAG: hypothetical protein RIT43_1189 [Bacteroidota bacterium]|jgi:hypothetical protein
MKLVNRGFIVVHPTSHFFEWANTFESEFELLTNDEVEPNLYLITEDFLEIEPVIEQNFKKIFKNELAMITENEQDWPGDLSFEAFNRWFTVQIGSTVFDLEKSDLRTEKL